MKQLYQCEKCGNQSDDYQVINKCEESHIQINDQYSNQMNHAIGTAYAKGVPMPTKISVYIGTYYDDPSKQVVHEYQYVGPKKAETEAYRAKLAKEKADNEAYWEEQRRLEKERKEQADKEAIAYKPLPAADLPGNPDTDENTEEGEEA